MSFPNVVLGSCSAGGKWRVSRDVTGGSLPAVLGDEKYALKNDWAFIEIRIKPPLFLRTVVRIEGAGLARVTHAVILQSPGLPQNVEKRLLSAPYAVQLASPNRGEVSVSIRLNEEVADATILGWDGQAWEELATTVADKQATGSGPLYEVYIAVE